MTEQAVDDKNILHRQVLSIFHEIMVD